MRLNFLSVLVAVLAERHAVSASERKLIAAIVQGAALSLDSEDVRTALPLLVAIAHDNRAATQWLLQHGFDPNQESALGYAPLSLAALMGNEAIVAALLHHQANPNVGGSRGGAITPPLIQAVRGGHLAVTQRLLLAGADVNRGDSSGKTALHVCAAHGEIDGAVTQLLLVNGAAVRRRADDGYDAIDVALESRNRLVAQLIFRHLFEQSLDATGHVNAVNGFVNDSAQPFPALSDESAVLWLNALIAAQDRRVFDRVLPRLPSGLVDVSNRSGHFPLSIAATWGERDMVRQLIQHGASTNHHNDNRYGTTPLMESTRDGHVAIAQELLARGADINALDKHQDNALNWAVYFGQQPLVELLLAHQANFNQVGQQTQDNALDIARRQRFAAIAMLLEKAGAKPTK